jgi:hypothetical protein
LQLCALNSYVQHLQEGFEAAVLGVGMTEARKVSLAQDKSIEELDEYYKPENYSVGLYV